jgi:acyl transferase domain-containing protein
MSRPKIAYISNLTGSWITAAEATDPNYWVAHLRQTVRFGDGLAELMKDPAIILLEVGPGQALTSLANLRKSGEQIVLGSLARVKEKYSDEKHLLNVLGRLWVEGVEIDWTNFYAGQRRRRLPLPTYPFERQRYFVEPSLDADARPKAAPSIATNGSPDGNHGSSTIRQPAISSQPSPLVAESRSAEFKPEASVAEAVYYDSGDGPGDAMLEGIIERQLEIMSQQLFVLHASNQIAALSDSVAESISDQDSGIARGFSETIETA